MVGSGGPDGFPLGCGSLNTLLRQRAIQMADGLAYCLLARGQQFGEVVTYAALDAEARALAAQLRAQADRGERVLLLMPAERHFLTAFFACLYAGLIAVPVELPRPGRPLDKLRAIVADCTPRLAIMDQAACTARTDIVAELAELGCTCLAPEASARPFEPDAASSDTLALLQYTSGSTGAPKGVMVSHGNVLATLADLDAGFRHGPDSRMVSWLPVFHDMGLVYGVLQPLFGGFPGYLMQPVSFLQRPLRWLKAISDLKATHSAAPNFAYQLVCDALRPGDLDGLDLSCWQVALNGAEPLRAETLERFARIFGPCGLDPRTMSPGYGLAETTLKVAAKPRGAELRRLTVDPVALETGQVVARPQSAGRVLVGHGGSGIAARIEIVDPQRLTRCKSGQVGEIWVASPAVAQGYWRRADATAATFGAQLADTGEGPFLRTGDIGFVDADDLFVTGRLKDLIIVQGRNHYPHDIEATVQSCHPALRPDHGAAFAIDGEAGEQLVVVQEVQRRDARLIDASAIIADIRAAIAERHDLRADTIVLIAPGTLARTSSGKIQRGRCREAYLAGALRILHASERRGQSRQTTHPENEHVVGVAG